MSTWRLVFFSFASILALLLWKKRGFKTKYLLLSAGFCGLALGTKYNGLMFMLIMMVLMPWLFLRGIENNQDSEAGGNLRRLMASQFLYICIALVLFSPWMIRNYNWTGNPVYPLYDGIFNPSSPSIAEKELRPSGPDMNPLFIRRAIYGETWSQILAQPLRVFYEGEDNNPRYFDGKMNPFYLVLPLLAFIRRKEDDLIIRTEKLFFLFFSVLFLVFAAICICIPGTLCGPGYSTLDYSICFRRV